MSSFLPDRQTIFMYGPPGVGKSTVGNAFAAALDVPFYDIDQLLEERFGLPITEVFTKFGEPSFRKAEKEIILALNSGEEQVIALGGGALLDGQTRSEIEARGVVVSLDASRQGLVSRLRQTGAKRPLLFGDTEVRLEQLLSSRQRHYASFSLRLDTSSLNPVQVAWQIQVKLGMFRVQGMETAYDVRIAAGGRAWIGAALRKRGLLGPVALVTDENVGALYAEDVIRSLEAAGYDAALVRVPAGEKSKNLQEVARLWEAFLRHGLDRKSTVLALGGGVVSDLAGFAAGTYMRGIPWAILPTSLLAMVDASLGGKTGIDLPMGKNLAGAFHPPSLVLSDPEVLATLPQAELRSGMAEVVKHALIADADLFRLCRAPGLLSRPENLDEIVKRAIAVKLGVVAQDPYEKGRRAVLNLGHTVGHALERASGYHLRHGEAVAIGMVVAARLARAMDMADEGLERMLVPVLKALGLPTEVPSSLELEHIMDGIRGDKKRRGGEARFVLPRAVGWVEEDLRVPPETVRRVLTTEEPV